MVIIQGITSKGKEIQFRKIVDIRFQSDRLTPADQLDLMVLDEIVPQRIMKLSAQYQGTVFFQGIVDVQKTSITKDGYYTQLQCRSRAALLLDNEVRARLYFSITAQQLIKEHAVPYGIDRFQFPYNACLRQILAEKGMSHWEFIQLFCRLAYGKTPYLHNQQTVCLTPFSEKTHLFSNIQRDAIGFYESSIQEDRYQMISKLYIQTDRGENGAFYQQVLRNHLAETLGIVRERYYHPARQWENHINLSGENRIKEYQMAYLEITLSIAGIVFIQVGDNCIFQDKLGTYNNLYVAQVVYEVGKDGLITKLKLWDKQVV